MSTVLISGGSGLIGSDLIRFLAKNGITCRILTRGATNEGAYRYHWNPETNEIDLAAFEGTNVVINLAGANIIEKRWTDKRKELLRNSRIKSTSFLVKTIKEKKFKIDHFISASAVGYFGDSGDELLNETSPPGSDFLAQLCVDWEAEAQKAKEFTALSIVRIGLYLSDSGGFSQPVGNLANYYLATAFGSGKQYVNYTHRDELALLILKIIAGNYKPGTYNAVGPSAMTLNKLISAIAQSKGRKVILPNIPAFLLKLALGEASAALLNSHRVESPKLQALSFYRYQNPSEAINAL